MLDHKEAFNTLQFKKQADLVKVGKLRPESYYSVLPSGDIVSDPEFDIFLCDEFFGEEFEFTVADQSSVGGTPLRCSIGKKASRNPVMAQMNTAHFKPKYHRTSTLNIGDKLFSVPAGYEFYQQQSNGNASSDARQRRHLNPSCDGDSRSMRKLSAGSESSAHFDSESESFSTPDIRHMPLLKFPNQPVPSTFKKNTVKGMEKLRSERLILADIKRSIFAESGHENKNTIVEEQNLASKVRSTSSEDSGKELDKTVPKISQLSIEELEESSKESRERKKSPAKQKLKGILVEASKLDKNLHLGSAVLEGKTSQLHKTADSAREIEAATQSVSPIMFTTIQLRNVVASYKKEVPSNISAESMNKKSKPSSKVKQAQKVLREITLFDPTRSNNTAEKEKTNPVNTRLGGLPTTTSQRGSISMSTIQNEKSSPGLKSAVFIGKKSLGISNHFVSPKSNFSSLGVITEQPPQSFLEPSPLKQEKKTSFFQTLPAEPFFKSGGVPTAGKTSKRLSTPVPPLLFDQPLTRAAARVFDNSAHSRDRKIPNSTRTVQDVPLHDQTTRSSAKHLSGRYLRKDRKMTPVVPKLHVSAAFDDKPLPATQLSVNLGISSRSLQTGSGVTQVSPSLASVLDLSKKANLSKLSVPGPAKSGSKVDGNRGVPGLLNKTNSVSQQQKLTQQKHK